MIQVYGCQDDNDNKYYLEILLTIYMKNYELKKNGTIEPFLSKNKLFQQKLSNASGGHNIYFHLALGVRKLFWNWCFHRLKGKVRGKVG
jgi:hypothetical protein